MKRLYKVLHTITLLTLLFFSIYLNGFAEKYENHYPPVINELLDRRNLCITGFSASPDSALIYTCKAVEAADSIYGFGSKEYVDIFSEYMIYDCKDYPDLLDNIYKIVTEGFNPDSTYVAYSYFQLARILNSKGDFKRADHLFNITVDRAGSKFDSVYTDYYRILNKKQLDSDIRLSKEFKSLLERIEDENDEHYNSLRFNIYHQLAKYFESDNPNEGYPSSPEYFYDKAEEYFEDAGTVNKMQMLFDKYNFLLNKDHREAISCLDRIIVISESIEDEELSDLKCMAFMLKGDYCHNELMDIIQALHYYGRAIQLMNAPYKDGLQIKRILLGRLYNVVSLAGLPDAACEVAEMLVPISYKYGTKTEYIESLVKLGRAYLTQKRIDECEEVIEELFDLVDESTSARREVYTFFGDFNFATSNYERAKTDYIQALEAPALSYDDFLINGSLLKAASHTDKVLTKKLAAQINDETVKTILHKILYISPQYRKEWQILNDQGVNNLVYSIKNGNDVIENLFELSVFRKGLLFRTNKVISELLSSNHKFKEEANNLKQLKDRLAKLEIEGNTEAVDKLRKDIENKEWELAYRAINENPLLANSLLINTENVKKQIKENEILIDFISSDIDEFKGKEYSAIIISDNKNPVFLSLFESNEAPMYENIWGKIAPYLSEEKEIYFSTDGILNGIGIEFMTDHEEIPVNEKFNLHRVFHLTEKRNQDYELENVVAFGVSDYNSPLGEAETIDRASMTDLPDVAFEMMILKDKIGPDRLMIYFTDDASERNFKGMDRDSISILHISTHGIYRGNKSLTAAKENQEIYDYEIANRLLGVERESLSALLLRQGVNSWTKPLSTNEEDDILTAEEIEVLNFPALQLTVLSACDSGLGDIDSEGLQGLQRAFKIAGSKNIICSLNKVDDYWSAQFMGELYDNLMVGKNIYDSFRTAQKNIRESVPGNPVAWSSYILIE